MNEQVKDTYNDKFKSQLRSVMELDEFEFLKNKKEVERGMSEGLWIGVHEGSLLCRLAVMKKECGGMCGNELSTDDCPQERWNAMDDGEHWVVYYTPSNRAKIPLIDWDRVSDVREAVIGPVEEDVVRTFDRDLFTRINDMVWHTDNEEDSPYVVNPSQCKAFGRDINLKDIVENGYDEFDGWVVANRGMAAKLGDDPGSFVVDHMRGDRMLRFVYTCKNNLVLDNTAYIIPRDAVVLQQAQFPSMYIKKEFNSFEWFGGGIYRIKFDEALKDKIRLLNFGCAWWDDETKTIKEESNQ